MSNLHDWDAYWESKTLVFEILLCFLNCIRAYTPVSSPPEAGSKL
jgi:hypothetical protein